MKYGSRFLEVPISTETDLDVGISTILNVAFSFGSSKPDRFNPSPMLLKIDVTDTTPATLGAPAGNDDIVIVLPIPYPQPPSTRETSVIVPAEDTVILAEAFCPIKAVFSRSAAYMTVAIPDPLLYPASQGYE